MKTANLSRFGLRIDSPLAVPSAANFRPPSWPPPPDWPVMIDAKGNVLSRWGDPIWYLHAWAGKATSLNFGDGNVGKAAPIDHANADLLRLIAGWWLWGPYAVQAVSSLKTDFSCIRQILAFCSREGILASDLMRFPVIADRLSQVISSSKGDKAITLLHHLFEHRETLGFTLLDREGLGALEAALPDHEHKQTPYIPPRIWIYQVSRLRECLDDFLVHRKQIEACFQFCLDAYATNYGSLTAAVSTTARNRAPFSDPGSHTGALTGRQFLGPFVLTAQQFGIDGLLDRWLGASDASKTERGIKRFTTFLSLVSRVGIAYATNFSLMRVEEAWNMRADCLRIECDERFGDIYILQSVTTKTTDDPTDCWPTSPSVKVAVDAIECIARLRMTCAKAHSGVQLTQEDINNPYLIGRAWEPWAAGDKDTLQLNPGSYWLQLRVDTNRLFDLEVLRITEEDLELARLITPTLDPKHYAVGMVWPIAWHQLRRTTSVNMQASGIVSDASVQYLMKHAIRATTLYYGQNYSRLRLNDRARDLFIRTMYEVLGNELERLNDTRFVSPHGEKRKEEVVRLIVPEDVKKLSAMAKKGLVSCRQILLGYCMNREPCPYGGIDSVAHCGGGDSGTACAEVLYDSDKQDNIRQLGRMLDERLVDAPPASPLQESLKAQKRSVENYFNVIQNRG